MLRQISKFILTLWGWKIEGSVSQDLKKFMMIALPHTSNWDFPLGILVRSVIQLRINFVGKDSLFKPPFGGIFRYLGGYPVDRSKSTNFVDAVAKLYNENERFALLIAPEGTRKKVKELKTGFYYIALKANVPIILMKMDWPNKIVTFSKPFFASDDKEENFQFIEDEMKGIIGKNPEWSWPESKKIDKS